MNIQYKNYRLVQTPSCRFDLIVIKTVEIQEVNEETKKKSGTGEFKEVENEYGYDMHFNTCIDCIAKMELMKNEDTVDLKTFLKEYNRIKDELLTEIKIY